ncbi:MAG: ComEA family DNA-binding protein [Rugosibacter sp.]|nr:ComEA family DNA-binding protein [Rugosibacter sp.]
MKKLMLVVIGFLMSSLSAFAAVNVNTATQEQLESLNGIGPAKAQAIIEYRQKNGGFKTLEDLDKVPGIGEGVLSKIKSEVTLTGASSVKIDAKPAPAKSTPAVAPATKPSPAPVVAAPAAKADAAADKKAAAKAEKEAKKAEKEAEKEAKKADKEAKKSAKKAEKDAKKAEEKK